MNKEPEINKKDGISKERELRYEDFLEAVDPVYRDFVNQINDYLLQNGCKLKIKLTKSGYHVSYSQTKTKRVIANLLFRKNRLVFRIYGDNVEKYMDFMETLPEGMIKSIEKSRVCKRLSAPEEHNFKCSGGYDFSISDSHYQKCKYKCFMFEVDGGNIPYIKAFLENEIKERSV